MDNEPTNDEELLGIFIIANRNQFCSAIHKDILCHNCEYLGISVYLSKCWRDYLEKLGIDKDAFREKARSAWVFNQV